MARVLVFSGVGHYGDPWHRFSETSAAVAAILRGAGHDVVVRGSEPGALLDLAACELLIVNAGGRTNEHDPAQSEMWVDDHRALKTFHANGQPILGLHTAVATFQDWAGWPSIMGGRWGDDTHHPPIDEAMFQPAGEAFVHPVWRGIDSVEVFDERYSNLEMDTGSTPLVEHLSDGFQHTMGWAVGDTVVYDGLGHDVRSYASRTRRRLLLNEVDWLLSH